MFMCKKELKIETNCIIITIVIPSHSFQKSQAGLIYTVVSTECTEDWVYTKVQEFRIHFAGIQEQSLA